jgi:UDP-N-acetylmuramoyl-tripeptide--D-alanyl-D-alanine ligase
MSVAPTLSDMAQRLGVAMQGADASFTRLISDTRQVQVGDCFVALSGDRFDGHDYLAEAAQRGAVGALVSRRVDVSLTQVVVDDSLQGLQDYARSWRSGFSLPVIGVTGSNGKTTTKQLLAAVVAARGAVLATQGNLNNHIGVPLTLARLRSEHAVAVIEMGANHAGEIAQLAALAQPKIGVVTQAGDAHLEGFGSREGVARAKGELFAALGAEGTAVINADDVYAGLWGELAGPARCLRFGLNASADVRADQVRSQRFDDGRNGMTFRLHLPDGEADVRLPLPGAHNVLNALAAAACGHVLGLSPAQIAAGLERVEAASGRVVWKRTARGVSVIDDSYNANPTSLAAGLQLLASLPGQRWAVLGAMAELGPTAPELHEQAGHLAHELGIDRLYVVGQYAQQYAKGYAQQARIAGNTEQLAAMLCSDIAALSAPDTLTLLIKGSRSARMETIVAALVGDSSGGMH